MDTSILITGFIIMFARILDVSMGTLRTIVTVQGRMVLAFILGFVEITIWVTVVGAVITQIKDSPLLILFYALGYALGNVVGIMAERKLALGSIVLRLITTDDRKEKIIQALKDQFLNITCFAGMGSRGPVTEIYTVCSRKELKDLQPILKKVDPDAFYVTEPVRDVSRMLRPMHTPATGWRAVLKKK